MVTTGSPSSSPASWTTEVVDVVNGETCADVADFPLPNTGAVGANLDGTPVLCGGYDYPTYYQTCYKFTDGGWQEFASMNKKRSQAAGVIFQNKFHVFGGFGGSVIWHSRLWSFQGRDTKLERFLAKNQLYSNETTKF